MSADFALSSTDDNHKINIVSSINLNIAVSNPSFQSTSTQTAV